MNEQLRVNHLFSKSCIHPLPDTQPTQPTIICMKKLNFDSTVVKDIILHPIILTSVPHKKIVSCIFIDSLCLYHEFYGKFLFHIANSLCQKLQNEAYYISVFQVFIKIFLKPNTCYYLFKWDRCYRRLLKQDGPKWLVQTV